MLERAKFPAIRTLDTSKTPKAGDTRITAPVLAYADLAKIKKQIQAIQAAQSDPRKRATKEAAKPILVLPQTEPAAGPPPPAKELTATAPSQLGAAILAARTAAGLSQAELATKLKTAQAARMV